MKKLITLALSIMLIVSVFAQPAFAEGNSSAACIPAK